MSKDKNMIKRTLTEKIIQTLKTRPVTLITGARQVGKTTICKTIMEKCHFSYVTLDDYNERNLAMTDPELFLKIHKAPLIIDEVQYAPRLFEEIEKIVNEAKFKTGNNYGMFVLTGSQAYHLMEGVSQSMAGRVSILKMSPLSSSEIFSQKELPFTPDPLNAAARTFSYKIEVEKLYKMIVKGFYPELYDNPKIDVNSFYSDYIQTYLERDVSSLINIGNRIKFQNFIEILASLTGEEFVVNTISNSIGVDAKTIQSWTSILEAGNIIKLIKPYNEISAIKRVVKRPKIYFNDTGLACYLARLNDPETLMVSAFSGRFVETYIVNEIMKSYCNNGIDANFFYYRDSDQNEIDLIIQEKGTLNLIECKSGINYNSSAVKAFEKLNKSKYAIGPSCIICNTDKIYKLKDNVYALPITSI